MEFTLINSLSILLGLLSPLIWFVKDELKFRLLGALIPFLWAPLNYAQGLLDSALILYVISLRALCGIWLMHKSLKLKSFFSLVFVAFFTLMLFKGYENIYSWLPWFAACLTTVCQLFLTGVALRLTQSIGADGAWILYDWVNKVWGHLFEKTVGVLINFWTVSRMLKNP